MRSTFSGFSTARSGLFAAQRALDIVGHNLANTDTKGYSRQRLNQSAANPMQVPGGMLGLGVDMLSITQIRDEFLDVQLRKESTTLGRWEERQLSLSQIENTFNEPSGKSIRAVMDNFYTSMHTLMETPSDPTARKVMAQNAATVTENLNFMAGRFEKLIQDLNNEVESTVKTINTYGAQIATLNEQIFKTELGGGYANDLRDKRNVALDELSKLVNIQIVNTPDPASDGKYYKLNVLVQGSSLVMHDNVNEIELIKNQEHPLNLDGDKTNPPSNDLDHLQITNLRWANGSYIHQDQLDGVLGGQLEMRDNFEGDKKGVPYYLRMMNEFANQFAQEFNSRHHGGVDQAGIGGLDFFKASGDPDSDDRINARNIQVNKTILDSPSLIAVGKSNAASDNINLENMLALREDGNFTLSLTYPGGEVKELGKGRPDDVIKSIIGVVGVDAKEAIRKYDNQLTITEAIDSYRMSTAGVSQDEEMSNMIRFQHAYNASARMITTIDEMIDVLINRMGRVGL